MAGYAIQALGIFSVLVPLVIGPSRCCADESTVVTGCFLHVKQQVEVPARDRGALDELLVEPGVIVAKGDAIGSLELTDARLNYESAKIELETAVQALALSLEVEVAAAMLAESEAKLAQARVDAEVAKKVAESELPIQAAEKAMELATEELARAKAARERFTSSISEFELLRLGLVASEKSLAVDQAKHDRLVDQLRAESRSVGVTQFEKATKTLALERDSAMNDQKLAKLNIQKLEKAVELAEEQLRRRQIVAPIPGIVVERLHEPGEWVEPGEPVVRIVRLDRLVVEGYVLASAVSQASVGKSVEVDVRVLGENPIVRSAEVVFVSPEVDRVNQEVLIRAELDNSDLKLRPGLPASIRLGAATIAQLGDGR